MVNDVECVGVSVVYDQEMNQTIEASFRGPVQRGLPSLCQITKERGDISYVIIVVCVIAINL